MKSTKKWNMKLLFWSIPIKQNYNSIAEKLEAKRDKSASRNLISNTLKNIGIEQVAFNKNAADELLNTFSIELPFSKITHQQKSGRCWLFAALNTVRQKFINEHNLEDFEFSTLKVIGNE